jgi:hypothetical protein
MQKYGKKLWYSLSTRVALSLGIHLDSVIASESEAISNLEMAAKFRF